MIEFFAKLKPKKLTSLHEDWEVEHKQYMEDEKRHALRRAGKLQPNTVETTYERYPEEK